MRIEKIIESLSLEEKAALLQGWTTWTTLDYSKKDIPPIFLSDGPHGLRKQAGASDHLGLNASVPATCFPTAATMANSWNPELGEALGTALGEEAAANNVHVVLGPGLNIKRSPLCGRNFEYFSEDPYLAGKMAAAYVRGIQSNGISACPKHFAVNSQELRRMCMDSVLDERTLREIYLTAFEIAVKESKPKCIMSSYNMVNGTYANENRHLLTEVLREDWGFDGFVVTDWGADNDHAEGVKNGSNLVMPAPGPDCAIGLVKAVKEGRVSEKDLDDRLREMLPVILDTYEAVEKASKEYDKAAHHEIARKCAEESIVLLDNDGILPLNKTEKIGIIGDFAIDPRYQGAGSSLVNATQLDNLKDALDQSGLDIMGYAQGYARRSPNADSSLIDTAVELAKLCDVVLLCVGLDEIMESEGMDRQGLNLSEGQLKLMDAVFAANKNVVLVLSGGSPFIMPDKTNYRAAINGYLGGQAGANAMVDALTGKVNPSGKLNETWPNSLEENPSHPYFPSKERTAEYREGLYIGYRYYNTVNAAIRYPFGYGLSYTTFEYSSLKVSDGKATFTLTNTGSYDGAEVCQLYISCKDGKVFRPAKELKGFTKVFLKAGESKEVTIELDDKAFRYYNVKTNGWEIETATYCISIAADSCDVRLSAEIHVDGTNAENPYANLPSYESGKIMNVGDEEFAGLLGRKIPDGSWSGELGRNDAICQLYYSKTGIARFVYRKLTKMKKKADDKGKPDLNILFIYNMPFRAIGKMSGGMVSDKMVDDIVFLVNGHFWRGLGRVIRDFFRNQRANKAFCRKIDNK